MVTWQLMTSLPSSKHWRPVGLAQDWILVGECPATAGCYGPMVFPDRLRRLHWCWTEPLLQSTIVCVEDLTANTSWKSCLTFTLKASSPISSLHFFQFYSHWDSSWWVFADKYNFRCLLETKHLLRCFQCSSVLPPSDRRMFLRRFPGGCWLVSRPVLLTPHWWLVGTYRLHIVTQWEPLHWFWGRHREQTCFPGFEKCQRNLLQMEAVCFLTTVYLKLSLCLML